MDLPMASVQESSGRCSPLNGSADSKVSFGFSQEQVECVCEVSFFYALISNKIISNSKLIILIIIYYKCNHISYRYCNMLAISKDWGVSCGHCHHVINYNWMNQCWKQKQLLHFIVDILKNCIICWNIINFPHIIMLNCRHFGLKHIMSKLRNYAADHWERLENIVFEGSSHYHTPFGTEKKQAIASKWVKLY